MTCVDIRGQFRPSLTIIISILMVRGVALAHDQGSGLPPVRLESWTTENGLPQNSINDILQTRDGYLWLATHGGLVRFDGLRFVVFDRSIEGIGSQRIKALCEDGKGTLWAGTEEGMLIRYQAGRFTTFIPDDPALRQEVFRIDKGEEGILWITGRGVLLRFEGDRFIGHPPGAVPHHVGGYPGIRNVSWVQDALGLHCIVKGQVLTLSTPDLLRTAHIIGVTIDPFGSIWIQTKGLGVLKLTNGQSKLHAVREGLLGNEMQSLFLEDRKGDLWLADYRGSLYRRRKGDYQLIRRFPSYSVGTLYEDREGCIWVGTALGLSRIDESPITLHTERDGLSLNAAYSVLRDRAGAIWIGTWGGGLNKLDNGRFTHYRVAEGLPSNQITSIYEDASGRLWVGANNGVSYFNKGRFIGFEDPQGLLKRDVWAIHQDRAGSLWFGTDSGLVKLKGSSVTHYTTRDGLSHDVIRSLFEDQTGTLWIGTDQGLTRLQGSVFTAFTERDGLIGNQVRAIYEDSDGILWVGTYDGGLYRFNDGRLTRYTKKEGLHDNGVFQILEDDAGNLWMGCNRGIYRVSRRELNDFAEGKVRSINSVVYGTEDGLTTLECNGGRQPSGIKTKDGKLWFPTMGGVAVIDTKTIRINPAPPVIVEEFLVDNEASTFLDGVRIRPDKETFEIRYTAPSFVKPEHVRFKYKLVGLNDNWIDAGNRRIASYNRVAPGRYKFIVIAANSDGIWNAQGQTIEIVVVPPFWRTSWFLFLSLLLVGGVILFAHRRRVRHLHRKQMQQEAFSRRLIESQENERKRIASELHDGLGHDLLMVKNSALLGCSVARDGSQERERFDEISEKTSKALAGIREISHNLRPYHLDRLGLRDALEFMIEEVGRSSSIRFSAEIEPMDGAFSKEAELNLYRIVEESINNIIKHSDATLARVVLKHEGRHVRLTIEDDGKGFDPGGSSTGNGVMGFGLTGISERTRMLGGQESIHSVPGQGTTITLTVKLRDDRYED